MSISHTKSKSDSFTLTHAKYLAGKVISDMQRCHQIYGKPNISTIDNYQAELVQLLRYGYISTYEFGFEDKNKSRIVSWKYTVFYQDLVGGDNRPGSVYRKADITGGTFFNFINTSQKWTDLSFSEKEQFNTSVTISRTPGNEKGEGNGFWQEDKCYSTTGCLVTRKSFQPY